MIFVYRFMKNRSIHIKYQHVPSPSQSPSPSSSLLLLIIIIMIMRLLLIPQKQDQKGGNMISLPPCGYDFLKKKNLDHPDHQYGLMENMELYALYMQCIAYPTYIYIYIYIPLICQLHTIYKLKIYINHLRFYVIFHNYLPLTLMWPRQIHTHIFIYIYIYSVYIYIYI